MEPDQPLAGEGNGSSPIKQPSPHYKVMPSLSDNQCSQCKMKWSSRWYAPLDNTSRLVCKECHDKDVNTVRNPAKSCETCGTASRSRWHPGTNPDAKLCHACYSKKHKKQPPLEVKVVERDGKTVGYARPNPRSTVRRSAVSKRASVDEARDTAEASVVSLGASHLQTGSAEGEDAQAGEPCSEEAGTLQGASHPGGAHDEAARDGARGSLSDASTLMAMPTSGGKAEDGAQEAATEGEQVGSESAQKEEDLAVVEEIATPPTGGVPDPAGTSLEKDQTGKSSQEGADRAPATVLQETPSSVSVKRRLRNSEEGAAEAAGEDEGPQKKRSLREMEKRSPKRGPKSVSGIGPAVVPRKGGRGEGGSGEGLAGNGGKRCDDCGATESRAWYGMSQGVCRCSICYSRDYEKNRRAQRSGAKELELLRLDAGKGGSLRLGSKRKQPLQSPCKSGASVGTPGPAQKGGKRKQGEASRGAPGPSKRRSEPGQESEPGLCTDCGTRESSHWYRGPRGPRTQCRKCYDRVWGGPCHLCSADVSCMWYGGPNGPRTTCSTCYGRYFRPKKDSAAGEVSKRSLPQKPVSLGRGVSLDAELVSRRVGILWPIDGVYYKGRVIRYTKWNTSHEVLYDDGAREFLKFAEERWKLLESEDESESEGEDDRDAQESEGREEEVEGADESENGEDSAGEGERAETEEGAGFEPEGGENSGRREETGGGKAANRGQENGQNGCAETSEAPRKWRRKSVSPAARKARARRSGGAETGAGPGGGNTKTGNGVEGGVGAEHEDPPAEHGQEIVSEVLRMVSDMERAEGASEELNEGLEGWSAERGGGVNGTDAGGAEVGTGGSGREGGAGADGAARAEAGLHIVAYKESPFASLAQPQLAPCLPRLEESTEGLGLRSTGQPPAQEVLPTPGSEPVGERPPVAADAATERPGDEARPAEVEATDSEANGTAPSTVTNGAAEPDPGANGTVPSAGMGGAVEPDPGANGTVSSSGAQEAAEADFRANGTVPSAGTAGVAEPDPGADGTVSCAEKGGAAEPDPDDAAGGSEQSGRSEPVRGAEPDGGVVSEADREMVDVAADVTMDGERDVMNEAGGTEARIGEEGGEGWEQRAVPETEESKEELDLMFAEGDTIFGPSVGLEIGGGEEEVAGRSENGAELGRESGAAGIEEASGTQKEAGADFEFGSNDDGAGVSTAEGVGKSDASGEEPGCDQLRLRVGLRSFVGDQDGVPQQAMDADRDGSVAGTGGADPEQRPEQENTQIGMAEPDPDDPSDQVTVLQQEAGGDAIALVAEVGGNEKLPGQNISRAERVPEPLGLEGEGDQLTNLQRAGSGEGQLVVAGAGGPAEAGGHLAEAEPDADDSEADPQGDQPHALQSAAEGDGQIVVAGGAPGHATWQPEEGSLWAAYGKQLLPGGFLWGAYADELPSDIAQTSANWAPAENARNTENRRAAEKSQWASERPPVCANCGFCKEGPAVGPGGPLGRMGMPPWGGAEPWAAVPVSVLREWILGGGAEVSSKTQPALGSGGPLQALEAPPGAGKKRGRQSPGIATMEPLQIGGTSAGEVAGLPQRDSSCGGSLKRFRPGSQAPGGARAAGDDVSDGALRGGASAAVTGGRVASLGDAEVG